MIYPLNKLIRKFEGRSCRTCLAFLVCRHQVTNGRGRGVSPGI